MNTASSFSAMVCINKILSQDKTLDGKVCFVLFFLEDFCLFCGPFLKSVLNLLECCFCFMSWIFGFKACGFLVPCPHWKAKS